MEASNNIISAFNETHITSKNQRNLIISVILTILYTSMYLILIELSYNIMFKYKKFFPLYSCITIFMGSFIQLPQRNSVQYKFANSMNKSFKTDF